MFRRRRNEEPDVELEFDADIDDAPSDPVLPAPVVRPDGPWDSEDAPDDDMERIDLGGLLVPLTGGHEVRVDVDQSTGLVTSVTLATPTSAMQISAFAAPRSQGIWAEIRAEIAAQLMASGGAAEQVEGAYGTELLARVPTDVPGQTAPARFVGVDGPRWFLRAMVQGMATAEAAVDAVLLDAFRRIVVVRGVDAMVVRDVLPLRIPADLLQTAEPEPPPPDLSLPERGPEITETR